MRTSTSTAVLARFTSHYVLQIACALILSHANNRGTDRRAAGDILTPYHALSQRFGERASYSTDGWHFTKWYKT